MADFTDYATHHKDNEIRKIGFDAFSAYAKMTSHDRFDETNNFLRAGEISINEVINLFCNVYEACQKIKNGAAMKFLEDSLENRYLEVTRDRKIQ